MVKSKAPPDAETLLLENPTPYSKTLLTQG